MNVFPPDVPCAESRALPVLRVRKMFLGLVALLVICLFLAGPLTLRAQSGESATPADTESTNRAEPTAPLAAAADGTDPTVAADSNKPAINAEDASTEIQARQARRLGKCITRKPLFLRRAPDSRFATATQRREVRTPPYQHDPSPCQPQHVNRVHPMFITIVSRHPC